MRSIVKFQDGTPPVLRMFIHNAPHRRLHPAVLRQYREDLWQAWKESGRTDTIDFSVDLRVTFINPTGPDVDNLIVALFQALDGKCGKKPTILTDDTLISAVRAEKLFL